MAFFVMRGNSREIASTTSSTDPCTKILSFRNLQEAKSNAYKLVKHIKCNNLFYRNENVYKSYRVKRCTS